MPRARRAALLGGGVSAYVDLNFAAARYKVGTSSAGDLAALPGFTFTRASLAMGYDATGKLTYGPNNLCLQSQTFDNASWVPTGASITPNAATAPDGTLTADKLVEDTSGLAHRLLPAAGNQQSFGIGAGLVASWYVKSAGRDYAFIRVNNSGGDICAGNVRLADGVVTQTSSGTISAQVLANGWVRIAAYGVSASAAANTSIEVRCSNSAIYANYTGDGTSGLFLWGAQLEAVTYQTTPSTYYPTTTAAYYGPRLVYDPVTLASQGILVEEARTNSALRSAELDNATWSKAALTVTADQYVAPDGTTTMDRVTASAGNAQHFSTQSITPAAAVHTLSYFARYVNHQFLQISCFDGTTQRLACFDLLNGTAGLTSGCSSTIELISSGVYRISLTTTTAMLAASGNIAFAIVNSNTISNAAAFNAAGTEQVGLWGCQFEAGTGASSPIPTTTASVTRAADAANVTNLSVPNPHSMVAEWTPGFDNATGFRRAASLTNAGFTSEDAIYQRHTNNIVRAFTTTTMDNSLGTGNAATANKAAARFELNKSTGSLNGAAVAEADTSTDPTTAINRLDIGQTAGAANMLNGTISRIRIYNRALPDAQLQSLTT